MRLAPAVLTIALLGTPAHALSCRNHGKEVQAAIKHHIEALRMIERETADRVAGLDTRPYNYLLAHGFKDRATMPVHRRFNTSPDRFRPFRNFQTDRGTKGPQHPGTPRCALTSRNWPTACTRSKTI